MRRACINAYEFDYVRICQWFSDRLLITLKQSFSSCTRICLQNNQCLNFICYSDDTRESWSRKSRIGWPRRSRPWGKSWPWMAPSSLRRGRPSWQWSSNSSCRTSKMGISSPSRSWRPTKWVQNVFLAMTGQKTISCSPLLIELIILVQRWSLFWGNFNNRVPHDYPKLCKFIGDLTSDIWIDSSSKCFYWSNKTLHFFQFSLILAWIQLLIYFLFLGQGSGGHGG